MTCVMRERALHQKRAAALIKLLPACLVPFTSDMCFTAAPTGQGVYLHMLLSVTCLCDPLLACFRADIAAAAVAFGGGGALV